MALEASIVLAGVLLRADVGAGAEVRRSDREEVEADVNRRVGLLFGEDEAVEAEGWRHPLGCQSEELLYRESRGNGGDEVGAVDAVGVLIDVGVAVAVEELVAVGKAGADVDAGGEKSPKSAPSTGRP